MIIESIWTVIGIALGWWLMWFGIQYLITQNKSSSYLKLKSEVESKIATADTELDKRRSEAQHLISKAQHEASELARSAQLQADKTKDFAQAESNKIMSKVDQMQTKLEDK